MSRCPGRASSGPQGWLVLALGIGIGALGTQPARGQDFVPAQAFLLREPVEELKLRFKRAFDPSQRASWKDGWRLAIEAGPTLTPFLLEQLKAESHARRRLLWIAALGLGLGHEHDDVLAALLGAGKRTEEKALLALTVALVGPRRGGGEPFARHLAEPDEEIVHAAFALALARHSARTHVPALGRMLGSDDGGVVAAALAAGSRDTFTAPQPAVERWFRERADSPRSELVMRAGFTNDAYRAAELAKWAASTFQRHASQGTKASLAQAAALHLARHVSPSEVEWSPERVPSPACLVALASEPEWRAALLERGSLTPVPRSVATPEERRRLASGYALAAGKDRLRAERELWQVDRDTAGTIVRELALLVLEARSAGTRTEPFFVAAGDSAERAWLDLAFGNQPVVAAGASSDAALLRALQAAVSGALAPGAAAHELEAGIVRSGVRPAALRAEAFRTLVRDVLLLGSRQGALRYARGQEAAGLPRGIPPDRDDFFETACEVLDFVTRSVPERALLPLRR